jgi:hypothetical protein
MRAVSGAAVCIAVVCGVPALLLLLGSFSPSFFLVELMLMLLRSTGATKQCVMVDYCAIRVAAVGPNMFINMR